MSKQCFVVYKFTADNILTVDEIFESYESAVKFLEKKYFNISIYSKVLINNIKEFKIKN